MTNTRKAGKTTRTISAALAALMLSTTAATIGASARFDADFEAYLRFEQNKAANIMSKDAEQFVNDAMKNKSYSQLLDEWKSIMEDPTQGFSEGCDINGDGVETEEEKSEVIEKLKEYAAGVTVGLMKMGLNACCDGLADCFEGPMGDLANAIFDVHQEASNDDIMKKLDDTTNELISKITESENNIIKKVTTLNVASIYGNAFDQLEGKADTARTDIKLALKNAKTPDEKAVAIASKLGDLNEWSKYPTVDQMGIARKYLTAKSCTTEFDHGYNLYDIAFRAALDKGSLFMKEAVENSQFYIAQCTNKYVTSCMTLLEMLKAMQRVSRLTPEEVAKMPEKFRENYNTIKNNAGDAYDYETEILNDLFGKDGIVNKSAAYVQRKVTEPTTYVAKGVKVGDHIKLRKDLDYSLDLSFIEPYHEGVFGYWDWRWIKDSDKYRVNDSGLTYSEVEGICKHALKTGYTVENYLKANGFNIEDPWNSKRILVTGHYDDYHGTAFKAYQASEGFKGFDITKKYSTNAGSEKWALINKHQLGCYVPSCDELRVDNGYTYMFFVKA